jgi:hypothetical protein
MTTVGRWLADGFRWWTGELASMVPARLRRSPRGPVAHIDPQGGVTVTRAGRSAIVPPGTAVIAAVPTTSVLFRPLTLPPLGDADLRRLVGLQIDRLMPFPPGTALIDISFGRITDGKREVRLAALPVDVATEAEAAIRRAALTPIAIRVVMPDGTLAHDFLPALRAVRAEPDLHAGRRVWWRLAGLLFALNIAVLIGTDVLALRNVERLVDAHAQQAGEVRRARRRVLDEEAWRQALLDRRAFRDPLAIIADLTRRMPAGASVRRLTIGPEGLRLAGVRRADLDVLVALRAGGRYPRVRNATTDSLAATPEGQPFDISFGWPAAR